MKEGASMRRFVVSSVATLLLAVSPGSAAERCFVIFFASQDARASSHASHCFAVFFRFQGVGGPTAIAEQFTISWLPASETIRLLARPEPGRNLSYAESLSWAARRGLRTRSWGPFEMRKSGYEAAVAQWRRLNSGGMLFQTLDRRVRPDVGTNCIHAISDIVPGPLLRTGLSRGFHVMPQMVRHFRPLLVSNA
jgi:hypothetical protein